MKTRVVIKFRWIIWLVLVFNIVVGIRYFILSMNLLDLEVSLKYEEYRELELIPVKEALTKDIMMSKWMLISSSTLLFLLLIYRWFFKPSRF